MGKIFNTTGLCRPDKHYMVNIDSRLLKDRLSAQYSVFSISFEGIGMNAYSSGYLFLVSRICKIIDENIPFGWTKEGLLAAVKELMTENNTLFDDMVKKLDDFPQLKKILYAVLFNGDKIPYNSDTQALSVGIMFGFLKSEQNMIVISNRIFETRLYNLYYVGRKNDY